MSENKRSDDIKEKGYLNEAFRLLHNTDILGTNTPVHFHTFYKATFIKYGKGSYMIDGRVYDTESGDIILVGINMPHKPSFEAGELYDRYTLYISSGMLEAFDIPECHICEIFSAGSANVIRPEKKDVDRFVSMLERIEFEKNSSSYGAALSARLGVIKFLIEAARCRQEASLTVPLNNDSDDKMLSVLRYVNENLNKNISVKDTASRFETDSDTLMSSFKEAFGCPFNEYIANRRLTRAREMIMLEGTGPAEACYECGYQSYNEFTEAYRTKYGTAPRALSGETTGYDSFSDFVPE